MQGEEEGGSGPAGGLHAPLREVVPEGPSPGRPGAVATSRKGISQNRPAEGLVEGLVKLWGGRTARGGESQCTPGREIGRGGVEVGGVRVRGGFHSMRSSGSLEGGEEVLWDRVRLQHGVRLELGMQGRVAF